MHACRSTLEDPTLALLSTVASAHAQAPTWQADTGPDSNHGTAYNGAPSTRAQVDPDGDVIIVGSGRLTGGEPAFLWIEKLASDGSSLWYTEWYPPSGGAVRVTGLVVDEAGDSYLHASVHGAAAAQVILAIAGGDGDLVWSDTFATPSDAASWPNDLTLDSLGRLVASGTYYDAAGTKHQRRRVLTRAGQPVWSALESARYRGDFLSAGPCAAAAGGALVCINAGLHTNLKPSATAQLDIMVTRYDSAGRAQWTRIFDDGGVTNIAADVAIDAEDNAIVVGYNKPESGDHELIAFRVRKSNGQKLWSQRAPLASRFINSSLSNAASSNVALFPTTGGDFIAVGREWQAPGTFANLFVRLATGTGNVAWLTRHPGQIEGWAVTPEGDPLVSYWTARNAEHDFMRRIDRDSGAIVSDFQMSVGWSMSLAVDPVSGRAHAIGNLVETVDGWRIYHAQCAAYD